MDNKIPTEFRDLPEYIQDILLSDETRIANEKIIKKFHLSAQQVNLLFDILQGIVFKQIDLNKLLEELEPLGLNKEQTKKIAVEILKRRVLPLSDYLKVNTLSYIKEWGGEIPADELSELVKTESQGKIDADSIVKRIIKETGIELEDDVLKNRFKNIIISAIRNVRTLTEIAIILKRSQKIGGMGFEQEIVDRVINALREKTTQSQVSIDRGKKFIGIKKLNALIKAPSNKLLDIESKMREFPKSKTNIKKTKNIEKIKDIPKKAEQVNLEKKRITEDIEEAIKKFQPKQVTEIPKVKVTLPTQSPAFPKTLKKPNKTMVESVSNQPKIYGPTDELKSISLIDWRRWGTPQEAILKIQEKINLLAEDSLVKKADGIKAWEKSEVNKLYLEIGEESINNGKSIEETIKERQKQGRKTLTQEEFNAVVELNQKLRF
ncbi:hypothetical protein B6D52_00260 [Candidatus Parcubacteria bacterium 4484_255]|nr:MAG: hypothetical protein B6D52_00260 [Candidatus Parcubacteria bacterium 4484_255]